MRFYAGKTLEDALYARERVRLLFGIWRSWKLVLGLRFVGSLNAMAHKSKLRACAWAVSKFDEAIAYSDANVPLERDKQAPMDIK